MSFERCDGNGTTAETLVLSIKTRSVIALRRVFQILLLKTARTRNSYKK